MLVGLEDGKAQLLRHDFRRFYGCSYDELETEEAIDLIITLPSNSRWRAARSTHDLWTSEQYRHADVMDMLNVINWRLAGCPSDYQPTPIERPLDKIINEHKRVSAKRAKEIIENTTWEGM